MNFSEMISREWLAFENEWLTKSTARENFRNAWKICAVEQFKAYLVDFGAMDMSANSTDILQRYCEELYKDEEYKILESIYDFELGYDEPQWMTFDDIHDMLITLLTEWDTYDENNNRR